MPLAYVSLSTSPRPNPDPITLARRALRLPDTATADEVRAAVDAEHARLAARRPRVSYVTLSRVSPAAVEAAARAVAPTLAANKRNAASPDEPGSLAARWQAAARLRDMNKAEADASRAKLNAALRGGK